MKNHKKPIIVLLPILMLILIFGIGNVVNAQKQDSPDYPESAISDNASEYYNDAENLGISFGAGNTVNAQKQDSPDYSQSAADYPESAISNNASEYYNDTENLGISFHSDWE